MITCTEHTARKRHACDCCGCWIWPGERYKLQVIVAEDFCADTFSLKRGHSFCLRNEPLRSREDHDIAQRRVAATRLQTVNEHRGTDFHIGERVLVDGKPGRVVGGNSSGNLDVLFDGEKHPGNCHPFWKVERPEKQKEGNP